MIRRSMMFLPGNSPSMLGNGAVLEADSVILDLEDAVTPEQKDAARLLARGALQALDFGGRERIIRINALDSAYWQDDLRCLLPLGPEIIMPPKVSSPDDIAKLAAFLSELEKNAGFEDGRVGLIPLIETALGVESAFSIARSSSRVRALFLGAEDLSADLHSARSKKGDEILYARGRLLVAARAAGIEVMDTPFTDTDDLEGLREDCLFARGMGFSGKAVISPRHLAIVNEIFSPSPEEILWARDVHAVIEEGRKAGRGAVSLRGKMIDRPIVLRAERILEQAEKLGLLWQEEGGRI